MTPLGIKAMTDVRDDRQVKPVAWQHRCKPKWSNYWNNWRDGKEIGVNTTDFDWEIRPLYASSALDALRARVEELERELAAKPKVFCAMLTTGVCDMIASNEALSTRLKEAEKALEKVDGIIARLRTIINSGILGMPGYATDKEIYSQMHGQVLRLLECDAPRRSALKGEA